MLVHRYKCRGIIDPDWRENIWNFAAPSPGLIESRNHGRVLFQQRQHNIYVKKVTKKADSLVKDCLNED